MSLDFDGRLSRPAVRALAACWGPVPVAGCVGAVRRRHSSFLVTYGPNARMECMWCGKATLLVRRLVDGSLTNVVHYAEHTHTCGPIGTPWNRRTWL